MGEGLVAFLSNTGDVASSSVGAVVLTAAGVVCLFSCPGLLVSGSSKGSKTSPNLFSNRGVACCTGGCGGSWSFTGDGESE